MCTININVITECHIYFDLREDLYITAMDYDTLFQNMTNTNKLNFILSNKTITIVPKSYTKF